MKRIGASRLLIPAFFAGLAGVGLWASGPPSEDTNERLDQSDVRRFGAVGDGTTDDAAAIQRAVDSGIGAIVFPKGTYRFTKTVVIDLDRVGFTSLVGDGTAQIVMAGPGPAFRFVGTHDGSAAPKTFKANVWERQRTPMIDGLEIVGAHPEAVGVEATGTMQFTATRLVVRKALHAVHLTKRNRNVILSNCHLYENRGIGVYYDDVDLHQSNIVGCHISYNGGGGVVSRAGNVRNIHIGTCDIESNHSPDGEPTANVLIDCSGGVAGTAEVAIVGCTIQHNHVSPNSANIRILGRSGDRDGKPVREGNVTIADNVFSDVQTNVHLRDCKGVTIVGNTFWMGFEHDLLVEFCTDIVVGPNNLGHNARYSYGDSASAHDAVVFRDCTDCTLDGLHLKGVKNEPAGMLIERCRRFNVTGCTILDCDGVGLWLKDVSDSRVSDCLIRDDRPDREDAVSLRWSDGTGNLVADNLLGGTLDVAPGVQSRERQEAFDGDPESSNAP